ncbi:penicillin acylase family protein [soil metagenome]
MSQDPQSLSNQHRSPRRPISRRVVATLPRNLLALLMVLSLGTASVARDDKPPANEPGEVEILRDPWGVPHVFARSDEAALFGLGYSTALDRGFQMHLARRIMQGRLAETIGEVSLVGREETSIDLDRKHRTFGWTRSADRIIEAIDAETLALLESYCVGVNLAWTERADTLDPLFDRLGTTPEPWTPADCLLCWWHLSQFFATDGTRDLIAYRNSIEGPPAGRPDPPETPPDDAVAVIQRADVSEDWLDRARAYLRQQGEPANEAGADPEGESETTPRFSHAWVVGGQRSTTGSTLLVSMPQTVVANPPLLYEFHISGETFNARGVGTAGSPALLIGFTPQVAWGLTALGADQADLFRLQTDPDHPDQYHFEGTWRAMEVVEERIEVKDGDPLILQVRETHLGPIVTSFAFTRPEDGEVALKRVPLCDIDRETVQGAFAMLRARDAKTFDAALDGWRFPSANVVFGDATGSIGYRTIGAFPLRSPEQPGEGRLAIDGTSSAFDWRGFVPHDLAPHVFDPSSGLLFSANHRPIGSFYPIPIGLSTGGSGDTGRSWRLRELLSRDGPFTPEQTFAVADDSTNAARRELVRLGFHLRDRLQVQLHPDALRTLEHLAPWRANGSRSELELEGTALALELPTFFRVVATPLAAEYGGGESGLSRWLRAVAERLEAAPDAPLTDDEQAFVESTLAEAWRRATERFGPDPETWDEAALQALTDRPVPTYQGLDRLPSLDPARDLTIPPLVSPDSGTIRSDAARAYVQFVRLDDVDASRSLLPQGNTEGPDVEARKATRNLWSRGELHPAPLSRQAIEAIATDRLKLSWPPGR